MLKKLSKILVLTTVLSMCVGAGIAFATDNSKPEGDAIAAGTLRVTYDIGQYGYNTLQYLEPGDTVLYPTARYKRNSADDFATHKTIIHTSTNGGSARAAARCVSDGLLATPRVAVSYTANACIDMEYNYGYGTTGYTNKLELQGYTSGLANAYVYMRGQWCPDCSGLN